MVGDAREVSIPDVLLAHAAADDGSEFLRLLRPGEDDCVLGYRELLLEAARWTEAYEAAGLGRGDRVIVVLPHSVDVYAAYLGALLGGFVPVQFAFPSPKLSEQEYFRTVGALIANADARLVVTYPELAAKLADRERAALGTAGVVTASVLGPVPQLLPAAPAVEPDDIAILQYSSGTTGLKKGVALSHRALLWQVGAYGDAIGAGPGDRIASWLPLYHDMGLVACLFLPLVRRIPLVAVSPFDWVRRPALWLRAVSEHRATLSWLPNFAYSFMATSVRDDELDGIDLSSLRGVVNCSEPVLAASHDAFLARFGPYGMTRDRLAASYAMAENTFAVTSGGFGAPLSVDRVDRDAFARDGRAVPVDADGAATANTVVREIVSSGLPLPETAVTIVGGDGAPLPERVVGEILLRSPCLLTGYFRNPDATAAAFVGELYSTGDLGYLADGEVFVTGRKQDLIIVGGRNIYPQDVEAVVNEVDGVSGGRVVAFGVTDDALGTERVVVLAESEEEDAARRDAIRHAVHAAVAARTEVVPSDVRLLPPRWLAKSSAGKIARAANRARYLDELAVTPVQAAGVTSPGDSLHDVVRRCVLELVERLPGFEPGRFDDHTPLVSSGLVDSFGLVELIGTVEAATGRSLGPAVLADPAALDSVDRIASALAGAGDVRAAGRLHGESPLDPATIPMAADTPVAVPRRVGLRSRLFRLHLRLRGARVGPGLRVVGPVLLQIDGAARNIEIGRGVTLMPGVHLKVRENGSIVLHDGVKLDSEVRLVAANDARIEIGAHSGIGKGTVVNAGRDVLIGRGALMAPYCVLNVSDHGIEADVPMRLQPYEHAPIFLGDDVWLGAHVVVARGSRIGAGAVVAAGSVVSGDIPPGVVVQGSPARVIKHRR